MRYLLFLQNRSASAYAIGRTGFRKAVRFNNDPDGRKNLAAYLEERSLSVFTVFLDFLEEELHCKTIPFVRGADRRSVLERMQLRSFPGSKLSCVRVNVAGRGGQRELDVTVAGVVSNSDCDAWFNILRESRTLVANVCSVSMLGRSLCEKLELSEKPGLRKKAGVSEEYVFLALQVCESDYRLCTYHDNIPVISRRVTVHNNDANALIEEIKQTISYLNRQADSSTDIELPTFVIGRFDREQTTRLTDEINNARILDIPQAAAALGLNQPLPSEHGDALLMAPLKRGVLRKADMSRGIHRRYFVRKRISEALYACGVCLVCTAAVSAMAMAHVNREYQSLTDAAAQLNRTTQESVVGLPKRGYDSDTAIDAVRESVRIARFLEQRASYTPFHFMSAFATDLAQYPNVEIDSMKWQQMGTDHGEFITRVSTESVGGEDDAPGPVGLVRVAGYVSTEGDNLSMSMSIFRQFISSLDSNRRYRDVSVLEAPFGLDDNRVTTGSGLDGIGGNARFLIELIVNGVD